MLDQMYRPVGYRADIGGDDRFREFMSDMARKYGRERFIPDYWLFRFDHPDKALRRRLTDFGAGDRYRRRLSEVLHRQGVTPAHTVRFRDAVFCLSNGIDPISEPGCHEALLHNPLYRQQETRYGTGLHVIRSGQAMFPTLTAVKSSERIMLFSGLDAVRR